MSFLTTLISSFPILSYSIHQLTLSSSHFHSHLISSHHIHIIVLTVSSLSSYSSIHSNHIPCLLSSSHLHHAHHLAYSSIIHPTSSSFHSPSIPSFSHFSLFHSSISPWCSSRFPQNSFSLISFIILSYSLFHPPFHPISTPSPSSPLIPAFHSQSHPCLLCIHSHPFPSHSSSHTLLSHSLLSIPISLLSFHSISSFPFISIFLSWLFVLSRSMVLYNFIIHRYHSLHPILFSFLFSIYLFSSLLIFFSLLWDQYHVCSDSRYLIVICCVD